MWMDTGRLILLLDGLDTVPQPVRESCVESINSHLARCGTSGICVCSTQIDYISLHVRLKFNGAVQLLPFSGAQANLLLDSAGADLSVLREAIESDLSWRKLSALQQNLWVDD
jgi:hypothetical protein